MEGWLDPAGARAPAGGLGWPPMAFRMLVVCMVLLAAAAGWLVFTRPVHRVEGDFLAREDRLESGEWLAEQLIHTVAERRARAYLALSRIRGSAALDDLVAAMGDPAPSVRAAAAFATGNLLDPRAGAGLPPEDALAALTNLLADDERLVATRAAAALGKAGWTEAAGKVTGSAAPIATAMTALVRLGAAEQSDFVAEYLDSDDQDSRWAAALAVHELRLSAAPRVWERLRPLLSDDNEFVRAAALRAASGGRPDADLLAAIRAAGGSPDPKVRYEAERALAALAGDPDPSPLPAGEPLLAAGRPSAQRGPLFEPADYQAIAKTIGARLRMSTALGDFDIELDYDQAPLTSEHVRRLAAAGALDGAVFAAVRPNGYAVAVAGIGPIRSELNPKPFLRGSLGLLRQRDASGHGFFLCLTALPLADGRYVNFGRLVSGDKLLDSIPEGAAVRTVRPIP